MDILGFVVAALVIAGGIVLGVWAFRRHRHKRAAAREWVSQRGWEFTADDAALPKRWSGFPFGDFSAARDVLTGDHAGQRAVSFELVSSGGNASHVVGLSLPIPVPTVELIRPEVANASGGDRQRVEVDHPSIGLRKVVCVLRDEDLAEAGRLVTPAFLDRLLADPDSDDVSVTFSVDHLFVSRPGDQDLQRVDARLALLDDLVRLLPTDQPPPG